MKPGEDPGGGIRGISFCQSCQGKGGKDADGGRSAHLQGPDGLRHLLQCGETDIAFRSRKAGLIQNDHAVGGVIEPYMIDGLVFHDESSCCIG